VTFIPNLMLNLDPEIVGIIDQDLLVTFGQFSRIMCNQFKDALSLTGELEVTFVGSSKDILFELRLDGQVVYTKEVLL
jgi:hypothetical protein